MNHLFGTNPSFLILDELTDADLVGALHANAIDTFPSVNGFPELQVSATNVPGIRSVVSACLSIIAERAGAQFRAGANAAPGGMTSTSQGVGDVTSEARGSGARFNYGKPDYSLIPLTTMAAEARVWAYGKEKYAAWNWTKGMAWSIPFACLMRHMSAWQAGEECDAESGLPHLAHAMCNLRMLTLYATNYQEGDDRPTKELQP